MEENFDEIEKSMKSNKKTNSKSSPDIAQIKAKVISWLMRNGNIKKLIFSLIILVSFGLISIINCIINNIFYIRDISSVLFSFLLLKFLIKSINKKFN